MISIKRLDDIDPGFVPIYNVLRRSPVANVPGAEATLRECVYRSAEVVFGYLDEQVACVWGLIPPTLLSTNTYLWLLTTELVAEHKFLFVRHSQRWIEQALKTYPTIIGDIFVDNSSGRRWLLWLGAEFSGPSGGKIKFMIRKKILNG